MVAGASVHHTPAPRPSLLSLARLDLAARVDPSQGWPGYVFKSACCPTQASRTSETS